jgi:hypothetical protein
MAAAKPHDEIGETGEAEQSRRLEEARVAPEPWPGCPRGDGSTSAEMANLLIWRSGDLMIKL